MKMAIRRLIGTTIFLLQRRCGSLKSLLYMLIIFCAVYITATSFYSYESDKLLPVDSINETGYTDANVDSLENIEILEHKTSPAYKRPQLKNEIITIMNYIQIGDVEPNCGLPKSCNADEFSVHVYTGKDHTDQPRLCVDGKYVLSRDVNSGGRGLNVAIIDTLTRTVTRVSHFDTYDKDSTSLETLLLTLRPGDIVIILTFDEPSRKLSRNVKLMLYDLGSALIQNLSYRGSWYIVTQKGINGFSPFEELNLAEKNGWPKHVDVRTCIPFEMTGQMVHPDPTPTSNPQRVEFCERNINLPLFCDGDVVNEPLSPAPVWKQPKAINKIYDIPIIVMSGENAQFLPLTLETLVRQPGLKPSYVIVYYLANNQMIRNLTELFGFMLEIIAPSSNYCDRVYEAFETTNLLFPDINEFLFISENAILAPDFLYYMGQLLSLLNTDKSVSTISAFNENGFQFLASDPTLVYRVQSFNGLAFLARKNFFQKSWCRNEFLSDSLYISSDIKGVHVVPDVSRVTLASILPDPNNVSSILISRDLTVSFEQNIALKNAERLSQEKYDSDLELSIRHSTPLHLNTDNLDFWLDTTLPVLALKTTEATGNTTAKAPSVKKLLTVYFNQDREDDLGTLQQVTSHLGLFHHPLYAGRGLYKGVLRFMLRDKQAALVGTKSPFFRPLTAVPVLKIDPETKRMTSVEVATDLKRYHYNIR